MVLRDTNNPTRRTRRKEAIMTTKCKCKCGSEFPVTIDDYNKYQLQTQQGLKTFCPDCLKEYSVKLEVTFTEK